MGWGCFRFSIDRDPISGLRACCAGTFLLSFSRQTTTENKTMADNGAEKRKADEMSADSVEVPLSELQDLAEKGGG